MHPVLLDIGLNWTTFGVVVALFFAGGLANARFRQKAADSSYLAAWLGLNVVWGDVVAPWGTALQKALMQAATTAIVCLVGYQVVSRVAPDFKSVPLHTYGVMMATAFMVGIYLAARQAGREPLAQVPMVDEHGIQMKDKAGVKLWLTPTQLVSDLAFYLLLAGLGGSNVLYNLTRWDEKKFGKGLEVLRIWKWWDLGLVWYGGLIAAFFVAWWFVRKHKVSFWPYADILVPSASLGHALGRMGCFAAGCCFGNPAVEGFPLAVHFPMNSPAWNEHVSHGIITKAAEMSAAVYPTQIMESLGEVAIFSTLLFLRSRKRFHGQVVLTYFFLYAILRVVIEMFRGDSIRGFFFKWPNAEHPMLLSTSQGMSIVTAIGGIALTYFIIRAKNRAAALAAPKAA